ncbi:MAG: MBL fold metallo-hydrolase [Bacteroidetes bacterium]|nr:MBL fold metallo-hydrolase [Bacteroidota bacterium]
MQLHTIDTGFFKLDGGAMFGVVPKSMWVKLNPPDDNNMCTWAMRCLLVEDGNRLILVDNGIGDKQDEKFFGHYYLHGNDTLEKSLNKRGFTKNDITDVFLSHLHFDHCGGSIIRNGDKLETAFKNATYWSHKDHWQWATQPNAREKASFLKENILPIQESGQLKFVSANSTIKAGQTEIITGSDFSSTHQIAVVRGHTDAMMLPVFNYKNKNVAFVADLFPCVGHLPIPYVMAYDTRPLITLGEKSDFLNHAISNNYVLFFEHDPANECCSLAKTEKGVRSEHVFKLNEL